MSLVPTATYTAPEVPARQFIPDGQNHSTNGKTTQISDIVIKAGGEDRDRPTEAKNTELGQLRAKLTTLQDDVNAFLTERMAQEKAGQAEQADIERRILDDGVDEDESD